MKTILLIAILTFAANTEAQFFEKMKREAVKSIGIDEKNLTANDAAKAIKEALIKGSEETVKIVSKENGFFKNPEIKIPFPEEADKVEASLKKVGLGKQFDEAVESMNRAAENASAEAKEILIDAISKMTVQDALDIVKGEDNAATIYLQENTTATLIKNFRPIIKKSLKKVNATKHWEIVTKSYNKIPFVGKIETDLPQYVTAKALEGLFTMIAKEELKIRENPAARTTELLKKVFGN